MIKHHVHENINYLSKYSTPTEFIELGNTIKGHGWPSA